MRLSCPSCQTEYDVPDAALTGRTRKLRCVTCGNQWEAGPIAAPEPEPEPEHEPEPVPETSPTAAEIEYMRRPRVTAPTEMSYDVPAKTEVPEFAQNYPPPQVTRKVELPSRIDPAEARHQADRESFAALLEASRQPGSQNAAAAVKSGRTAERKPPSPWLISFLLLLLVVALIYLERDHIMVAWPPSIRFFVALGLR